jgi:hypothetical protein
MKLNMNETGHKPTDEVVHPVICADGSVVGKAMNESDACGVGFAKTDFTPSGAYLVGAGDCAFDKAAAVNDEDFPEETSYAWRLRE